MSIFKNHIVRFYLLILSFLFILAIAWDVAIRETIHLVHDYNTLNYQLTKYQNPDSTLRSLQKKISGLEYSAEKDPRKIDEDLMNTLSLYLRHSAIVLEDFPEIHSFTSSNYEVETSIITLSGTFLDLLKFVDYAQTGISSCRIVSISFDRKVTRQEGEKLFLKICFQSIFRKADKK